jgi:hypothetical protein
MSSGKSSEEQVPHIKEGSHLNLPISFIEWWNVQ